MAENKKNKKRCMNCAHIRSDYNTMLKYCALQNPDRHVDLLDDACNKWEDLTKRVLPIKCCVCGKEGKKLGRDTLPNGWGILFNSDTYYCPKCYAGTARVIDREIVNRKQDKTTTVTRSVESFFHECFRI